MYGGPMLKYHFIIIETNIAARSSAGQRKKVTITNLRKTKQVLDKEAVYYQPNKTKKNKSLFSCRSREKFYTASGAEEKRTNILVETKNNSKQNVE